MPLLFPPYNLSFSIISFFTKVSNSVAFVSFAFFINDCDAVVKATPSITIEFFVGEESLDVPFLIVDILSFSTFVSLKVCVVFTLAVQRTKSYEVVSACLYNLISICTVSEN